MNFKLGHNLIAVLIGVIIPLSGVNAAGENCITIRECADKMATIANELSIEVTNLKKKISILEESISTSLTSGAVVAFELNQCPNGWRDYTKAYGRFIRGIDRSGSRIDPDGQRNVGSPQEDDLKSHSHSVSGTHGSHRNGSDDSGEHVTNAAQVGTSPVGGPETRPKNVALLYCLKI